MSSEINPLFVSPETATELAETILPGVITLIQQWQQVTSLRGTHLSYNFMTLPKPCVPLLSDTPFRGSDFIFLEPNEARFAHHGTPGDVMHYRRWIVLNESGQASLRHNTLYERMHLQNRNIHIGTPLEPAPLTQNW